MYTHFLRYWKSLLLTGPVHIWTVIFSLLLSNTLFAQNETFTGYYVGTGGDTVQGTFPDYRQWDKNPDNVKFLPNSSGKPVVLTPGSCFMFHIIGYESYHAYTGTRMVNPVPVNTLDINDLYDNEADSLEQVSTFLRVVFDNDPYRLLAFSDKKRINYFIQQKGKPAEELKFKTYKGTGMQLIVAATYRQQLAVIFNKLSAGYDANKLLEKVGYTEKELAGFMEKVAGKNTLQTKKADYKRQSGFMVTGGISVNSFNVTGDSKTIREADADFSTSLSPLFGIGYMARSNRNLGKMFFLPHVTFYRYKNVGDMPAPNAYTYSIKATYRSNLVVNTGVQLGYDLFRSRYFTWYMAPGGGLLYLAGNKKFEEHSANPGSTYVTKGRKLTYNINVHTGINLRNNVMIWASYALPSSTMEFIRYGCYHKTIQAGLSYRLKNK